jgi:hypothetical protein
MQPYIGTKNVDFIDKQNADIPNISGIFKGIVKEIDTTTRSSRIYVYITEFGGSADDSLNWKLVSYASPFLGYTSGRDNGSTLNSFITTKQTYGFYMSPPDIGSQVLCCFPSGNSNEGYWFASVNPNLSKYMVPAIGAVTLDKIDAYSIPDELRPYLKNGQRYPVGEFNENDSKVFDSNWVNKLRPLHIPRTIQLVAQGLDQDPDRGAISSSIQRDPVSSVFGFSTPGRPTKDQDPSQDPNLRQKLKSNNFNPADFIVYNRLGGHSLTMDDGDLYNENNLVQLRSASGHQILLNDSKGFIYISNSTGTSWVELTSQGDILIYGAKDFSVRAQGNIMMHSDNDITFNAQNNINVKAGNSVKLQGLVVQANADKVLNLYGQQAQLRGASVAALQANGPISIKGSTVNVQGGTINLNSGGAGSQIAPPVRIQEYILPDTFNSGTGYAVYTNSLISAAYKVPTHEPYIRGSVAAVIKQQEQLANLTATSNTSVSGEGIFPPVVISQVGADQADQEAVTNAAPAGAFIKQPDPGRNLGSLDKDQVQAYLAQVGYSQSGGNYTAVGENGEQGKYKLSAPVLAGLGYVQEGTTNSQLENPNVWTGKDGMFSASNFRNAPTVQEQAVYSFTKQNYSQLQASGLITNTTGTDTIAGLLTASHVSSPTVAGQWYQTGQNLSDATGTTLSQYYNQGRFSQTQASRIAVSNSSKGLVQG